MNDNELAIKELIDIFRNNEGEGLSTDELVRIASSSEAIEEDLGWLTLSGENDVAYAVIDNSNTSYETLKELASGQLYTTPSKDFHYYEGVVDYAKSVLAERFPDADDEDYLG